MSIQNPEDLPDDLFVRKLRQLAWLMDANHLPVKLKDGGKLLPAAEITEEDEQEEHD